ncbi:MAG: hypothetical protein FJ294_07035 [Planctomycetes bacterium]|nr:hypothetical protein [Planctomycetota bacterium]
MNPRGVRVVLLSGLGCLVSPSVAHSQTWTRTASTAQGAFGNASSHLPSLSSDGRWIAFSSAATNLVGGDTNNQEDVFVRDLAQATCERASLAVGMVEANGASYFPRLSADGRFVAFQSYASNLVAADTNGRVDSFVRDRLLGTTERVSIASSGAQGVHPPSFLQPFEALQAISADGRFVAFASLHGNLVPGDTNSTWDVFVRDRAAGTTVRASQLPGGPQGNGMSGQPAISANGRFVAFSSLASNLAPLDANGSTDVFVFHRTSGLLELVSVTPAGFPGAQGAAQPALSAEGMLVAFTSPGADFVPFDTNGVEDAFVRDRSAGRTERVSVDNAGVECLAPVNSVQLSADGRHALFTTLSNLLVPGDVDGRSDVFVHDRLDRTTRLVSLDTSNANAVPHAEHGALSADAHWVAFDSNGAYAAGDTNFVYDVYVRDLFENGPASFCRVTADNLGCVARSSLVGEASLSSPAPFAIALSGARNQRQSALVYGFARCSAPFHGGTLCIAPPRRRTPIVTTGGSALPASDCSGHASFDMDALAALGVDPELAAGAELSCQWFVHDPLVQGAMLFSDALFVRIAP